MSSYPGITNSTVQGFLDDLTECVQLSGGSYPSAAPNAFKDRLGKTVQNNADEVTVTLKISAAGNVMYAKIVPNDALGGAQAIEGKVNLTLFAADVL